MKAQLVSGSDGIGLQESGGGWALGHGVSMAVGLKRETTAAGEWWGGETKEVVLTQGREKGSICSHWQCKHRYTRYGVAAGGGGGW